MDSQILQEEEQPEDFLQKSKDIENEEKVSNPIRYKDETDIRIQRDAVKYGEKKVTKQIYAAYDRDACLHAHNKARSFHKVPSLTWSDDLAEGAKNWAVYLLENDYFENKTHYPVGENLYVMPWGGRYQRVYSAVYAQYSEVKNCDFNHLDRYSHDDTAFLKVGNFSQIVWKDTKQVGSAIAYDAKAKKTVIVTRFLPGQTYDFEAQVLPQKIEGVEGVFVPKKEAFISPHDIQPTLERVETYFV